MESRHKRHRAASRWQLRSHPRGVLSAGSESAASGFLADHSRLPSRSRAQVAIPEYVWRFLVFIIGAGLLDVFLAIFIYRGVR